jgi:hypothetical protein
MSGKKYGEFWLSDNHQSKPLRYEILDNGCFKIVGRKTDSRGVCQIGVNGTYKLSHRAVYEHFYGQIPAGLVVRHKCDNGGCINPEHLELGTVADNNRDKIERGRIRVNKIEYVEPDMSFTVNPNDPCKRTLDVKIDRNTGCWNVVNRVPKATGYFKVGYGYKDVHAHRFMYERFHGTIPEGYVVRHKCNNRSCVAPHHLTIGTQKDNVDDMVKSGRVGSAKLNSLQALFIRAISPTIKTPENPGADLPQTEVAEWFGVDRAQIRRIITGKTWKHLPTFEEIREIARELDVS